MNYIFVDVVYEGKKQKVDLEGKKKISDILKEMGINKETVLVSIDNEIYDVEEELKNIKYLKEILLLKVISGG